MIMSHAVTLKPCNATLNFNQYVSNAIDSIVVVLLVPIF